MKILDLPVENRDKLGSANSRRYRRAGRIPCVLYGRGQENVNLVTDAVALETVLKAHTALVRLKLGEEAQTALIREIRWDTFGEHVEHVDLTRVAMEDEVRIKVPVHCVGIPEGVHEGGELQVVHPDVEVFARVDSIPSELRIDVTPIKLNEGIHVSELPYPEHVRPAGNPADLIVHVVPPRKVEEPVPVAAEGEVPEGEAPAEGEQPAEGEGGGGES